MQDTIGAFLNAEPTEEEINYELEVVEDEPETTELVLSQQAMQDKENKFIEAQDYVNDNMKNIIEKGMDGLNDIMDVMTDSQDPKMYNACASYIKTLVDANKAFLENNKYGVASIAKGGNGGGGASKEAPQQVTQIQVNNGDVKVMTAQQALEALDDDDDGFD